MRERSLGVAVLIAVALALTAPGSAQAHKLKAFATAEGATIGGYAYFSPGGRAHHATVTVTAPDGGVLARMPTDDEGNFRFEANRRIDHRITVDGGDGHIASYTVTASELPDSLPDGEPVVVPAAPVVAAAATTAPNTLAASAELRSFIDQSVSRQIRPLREQIDAYQEKVWMHDVLGGLGVIFGLGGLAYGLSQRRRPPPGRQPPGPGDKP